MKKIIDINTWSRRDNYRFFQGFMNPSISITTEIDCTEAYADAKEKKCSFFLYYLYATLRAANEIEEIRYRIEYGNVVLYDKVDMMTPIQVNKEGKFITVRIPYHQDFETFYKEAKRAISNISEDSDPYEAEYQLFRSGNFDVILLSATPTMYFTSLGYTQKDQNGSQYPLMNAGKTILREGRLKMPFSINVHHGLMDGFHIGRYFELIEKYMKPE